MAFFKTILTGAVIGGAFASLIAVLINRNLVPDYLQNITTLGLVISAFALADYTSYGAGLFAVTIMGILITNLPNMNIEEIVGFKESLSLLLISSLFIILAARVEFQNLKDIGYRFFILLAALQFIIRPCAVFLSTIGKNLNWREKIFLSWVSPRGIIAASVAAIFSIRLMEKGIVNGQEARTIILLVFMVIMGTVILQSLTARILGQMAKSCRTRSQRRINIGANKFALAIAKALKYLDYHVVLSSNHWHRTARARMQGMDCYYGNPISEHADRNLELIGIGYLLALSSADDLNTLACLTQHGSLNILRLSLWLKQTY